MAKESMSGTINPDMMATGSKTRSTAMVSMIGLTEEGLKENGKTTTCMVKAFTLGLMAEDMKATI